jgi:predicted Zn finger-like uncharacterized protein
MKITCQTCQSKYTVSDEKVQGKTVKIKCRKCGATILVNSSGATTSAADAVSISTTAGELGVSFLVNVAEGDQRTMSLPEVVDAYNASVVTADTYVWSDGMGDWQPLGQVESIVAALNVGAAAAAPTATPEPAAYAAPAPYAAPYAAAAAAPPPAAEPAPRAAARRDSGRRGPDLFGGGMAAEEVASSAPAFNGRAPSPMAASGQREENSMLFSLSALTAKAAPSSPVAASSSKTSASREDSGLIDLRALAESAGASGPTNLVPDHAGLFPLGAPQVAAPIAAPIMSAPSMAPPAASKAPIFIGVGIAVAALAIVGAFFAMKGGDKPQPVAVENTVQAAPSAPPTVAPPPETAAPVASAAPATSASAAVAANTKTTKGGTGKAVTGPAVTAKTGGGTGPAAPAAPAVPAGPKKGNCGCAAGDLLCAMKCSAK